MNPLNRNIYNRVALVFVALVLVGFSIYSIFSSSTGIDTPPKEADAKLPDYSKSVIIKEGQKLFASVGNFESYDSLREDLFVYGKLAYEPYKSGMVKTIGFQVDDKSIKKKDSVLTFNGRFGSSKNKILVQVTFKNNKKIFTSIEDTKTKLKFDSDLPSNTVTNQFIGTLPIEEKNYTISYSEIDKKIVVRLLASKTEYKIEALKFLKTKIGIDNISDKNITILQPIKISTAAEEKYEWVETLIGSDTEKLL